MDYSIDNTTETITLVNRPAPQISIEPEIKYYDLQESSFNTFSILDYNKLNKKAIVKLKEKISKSDIKILHEKNWLLH